jgi:hypothetical protein
MRCQRTDSRNTTNIEVGPPTLSRWKLSAAVAPPPLRDYFIKQKPRLTTHCWAELLPPFDIRLNGNSDA